MIFGEELAETSIQALKKLFIFFEVSVTISNRKRRFDTTAWRYKYLLVAI